MRTQHRRQKLLAATAFVASWALAPEGSEVHAARPAASAASAVPTPPSPSPARLAEGRSLFAEHCAHCHGERGDGQGPTGRFLTPRPRNYAVDPFKAGDSVGQIFLTLKSGLPATMMVSFGSLPEEARWSLAWYVAHWRPSPDGRRAAAIVAALAAEKDEPSER